MVDSWYCLDRFVPEGISQVSRRSEVGNIKRRSLNTRLSSGTSAGTFAVSAGPYRNYHVKPGTKNEPWHAFGTISKKGLENRSSRFEPRNSCLSFSRFVSVSVQFSFIFKSDWGPEPQDARPLAASQCGSLYPDHFVLTRFIFKAPNCVLVRTLTKRVV